MKRHRTDLFSLLCGAVFTAIGLLYLGGARVDVLPRPTWILPLGLIVMGAGIVVATYRPVERERD